MLQTCCLWKHNTTRNTSRHSAHGYGLGHKMEVYSMLNLAIASNTANVAAGLPNPLEECISLHKLTEILYNSPINNLHNINAPVHPCFIAKAQLLRSFFFGVQWYRPVNCSPEETKAWIINIIEVALQKNKIMFIPWCMHMANQGRTKTPSTWS